MNDKITQLDRFLSRIQLLDPPYRESEEGRQVFQDTCKLVFEEQLYSHLWSEPTLNQLDQLSQTEKLDEELFGAEIEEIHRRTLEAQAVNNFFFGILDPTTLFTNFASYYRKFTALPRNFVINLIRQAACKKSAIKRVAVLRRSAGF